MSILDQVAMFLNRHERFKNSYFWNPPRKAYDRRQLEKDNSVSLEFDFWGDHYELHQSVECSCKNVYYNAVINRNGKRKDIRAVKSLIKDMSLASAA
jgi:hypothetical protein